MIKKLKKQKYNLKGERIVLRKVKPTIENALQVFHAVDSSREFLGKWLEWVPMTLTVEDSLKFLFDTQKDIESGQKIVYGIFLDNQYIGNISIFDIDLKNKSGEMGYWISQEFTRKGYVKEAIDLLEKEAFGRLSLNRVQIQCDRQNAASQGIAKKCGYKYEGCLRAELYDRKNKVFRDTLVFSKLKSELKDL